jgi:glycosyltransferase involved in cell wall biosynthesis
MSKFSLGVAMIMQNEETHIPAALAQFYSIVEDMVVVDGGSSDDSVMWAEKMGARVFRRPFEDDFSAQKNYAIEQLATDWVYFHDPDERLEPPLLELLPALASVEGQIDLMRADILPENAKLFDCIGIARKNYINGIQTDIYPDYQYRLFANYCRFEGAVHEQVVNFKNRTELDYKRPSAARPKVKKEEGGGETIDTERGQIETGVKYYDPDDMSRFNILHYKSGSKQKEQDLRYQKIKERS